MAIKVLKPGLATTVQDLGRPGYYHIGIPLSGGMDRHAVAAANLLVGNEEGAAVLEAVFMGPELEFTDDAMVAVTGAELPPKLDGVPRETWTSFKVKRGQKLASDFLKKGARAYIAVAGGIDVPVVLGSRSTYALGALGGFQGRNLEAGDELAVGKATTTVKEGRTVGEEFRGLPLGMPTELRVIPGLYWHRITDAAGKGFFPIPGRSRRKPTGSATASRVASRSSSCRVSRRSARAPIPPTSPMPAIHMARSRCQEALSRSCCIETRFQAVATSWSARSFRPIWI